MQPFGVGRRLIAAIIDGMIVFFGVGFAIAAMTSKATIGPDGGAEFHLEGGAALALFALGFAYYVVLEATVGATVGKYLLGVRVRSTAGGCIGWTAAVLRNVLRPIDVCFCCVGAILIFALPRHQRLGDLAAGTVVLVRRSHSPATPPIDGRDPQLERTIEIVSVEPELNSSSEGCRPERVTR
jgi:uncharacterized RDD family membrane protein YckC